jgi:hypothetical protein
MNKAYYFDLDNTLFFNDEGRILPNTLKLLYALKKEATFIAPNIKYYILYEFFIKYQLILT